MLALCCFLYHIFTCFPGVTVLWHTVLRQKGGHMPTERPGMLGLFKAENCKTSPKRLYGFSTPLPHPRLKGGVRMRNFSIVFQILFSGNRPESRNISLYSVNKFSLPFRYRKIPGDRCKGGVNPVREVKDLKKKCTSNFLSPEKQVR